MPSTTRKLRIQGTALKPTAHIGKAGLSDNTIKDIKSQLRKRTMVKVQLRPGFAKTLDKRGRKHLAEEIAVKANARLVQVVGYVFVLARKSA